MKARKKRVRMAMFRKVWPLRVMDDRGARNDIRKCEMGELGQKMDEAHRLFEGGIQPRKRAQ